MTTFLSAADFTDLVAAQYAGTTGYFDHASGPAERWKPVWSIKRIGDFDYIALRGSQSPQDWVRDFFAFAVPCPLDHGKFGPVHVGFYYGIQDAWNEIKALTKGPWVVGGHSLGAAESLLLAATMKDEGCTPAAVYPYAPPRPGFASLRDYLADVHVEGYCNKGPRDHDPVPYVPIDVPPFNYVDACALNYIDIAPTPEILLSHGDLLAWHNFGLYQQGVKTLAAGHG